MRLFSPRGIARSVGLFSVLLFALASPAATLAEDLIANLRVVSATVDMDTGVAQVVFRVDCVTDVAFIRTTTAVMHQPRGPLNEYSHNEVGISSCVAGGVADIPIEFHTGVSSKGSFMPGPARTEGLLIAFLSSGDPGDAEDLAQGIVLKPAAVPRECAAGR